MHGQSNTGHWHEVYPHLISLIFFIDFKGLQAVDDLCISAISKKGERRRDGKLFRCGNKLKGNGIIVAPAHATPQSTCLTRRS